MPNTLDVKIDNRSLRFLDDLRVQELDDAGQPARETTWNSVPDDTVNEIAFRFPNETGTTLTVNYGFNDRNQLTLQIPAQNGVPTASAAWTLQGKIAIDDNRDLAYQLIDANGDLTGTQLDVHALLNFNRGTDRLVVKFPDSSEAFILGNEDHSSLSADQYDHGGDLARDLIWFNASTENTVNGDSFPVPAEIQFVGRWDVYESQLVFVMQYDSTGATPSGFVAIAGRFKSTNVGLILERDGKAVFQIGGKYSWSQADLTWQLDLGYSPGNKLTGRLDAAAKIKTGKNGALAIKCGASFSRGAHSLDVKFDLALNYTAKWGSLDFTLSGGPADYQIHFGGQLALSKYRVSFSIDFASNQPNRPVSAKVEFGSIKEDATLKIAVQAILTRGGVSISPKISLRLTWGPSGLLAPV